jgi:hypothetical protein
VVARAPRVGGARVVAVALRVGAARGDLVGHGEWWGQRPSAAQSYSMPTGDWTLVSSLPEGQEERGEGSRVWGTRNVE